MQEPGGDSFQSSELVELTEEWYVSVEFSPWFVGNVALVGWVRGFRVI